MFPDMEGQDQNLLSSGETGLEGSGDIRETFRSSCKPCCFLSTSKSAHFSFLSRFLRLREVKQLA